MIRQLSYNLEGYTNSYIAYVPKLNETHKIVQGLVDAVREQYPLPPYQNERGMISQSNDKSFVNTVSLHL